MAFVGLKINSEEEKEVKELETLLRSMDPLQKIGSRSAAIKEAIRIALFHLKNSYFYQWSLTNPEKGQTHIHQTRYIERIKSSDVGLDGRRKTKTRPGMEKV